MPTYAQLQSESWWGREIITAEMSWLGAELCRRTGRPADAAGTKGDNAHLYGAHRSQEWILNSRFCTSRGYTVQAGLTELQKRHIAGFDFTPGNVEQMIAQSRRLMVAMKAGLLDEVLEIYCNVGGDQIVDGWDNVRDRAVTSDSSHLWHWHLTVDRRHCANRAVMDRVVAVALGDPFDVGGEEMGLREDPDGIYMLYRAEAADKLLDTYSDGPEKGKPVPHTAAVKEIQTHVRKIDVLGNRLDTLLERTAQPAVAGQPAQEQVDAAMLKALSNPSVITALGAAVASHIHVS